MKVLLLHPEDEIPQHRSSCKWDLVVDFGRAPISAYQDWGRRAGCRVFSLHDFAEEVEDLYRIKDLLQIGMGQLVDRLGIDWWDVLSLKVVADLKQLLLVRRLAREIPANCEVFSSRSFPFATVLQRLLGRPVINLESPTTSAYRSIRHYSNVLSRLNAAQLIQVLQDKFDGKHTFRRYFATDSRSSMNPVVLLPSAYISVSRMAASYAALLPDMEFLLVCARGSGELQSLPPNVQMVSLDSYFLPSDEIETTGLLKSWNTLREQLISNAAEFESANAVGLLEGVPSWIRWGIAVRTAWEQVLKSQNITGCICADDSNPYTRIPLLLAKRDGISSLACHHGALDMWMAIKKPHADFYLAKGEMERDYLVRTCRVAPQKIILGAPATSNASSIKIAASQLDRPWLVFFTEPYHTAAWRTDEVYRELLPRLTALALASGLDLVFKLHPFENVGAHRRLLRRHMVKSEAAQINVIAGAPSAELWCKTRFAVTGQSSVVMDCITRGIPVFLCAWLRDSYTGYVQQYARFGIGQILDSAEQIADIPRLLKSQPVAWPVKNKLRQTMDPEQLRELLCGTPVFPVAAQS